MRTDTPVPIQLADYTPYPFDIVTVALRFDLDRAKTRVKSTMSVHRTGAADAPMALDGEGLTLVAVSIDGEPLSKTAYKKTDTSLTLLTVPDAFELEIEVEIAPDQNTALSGLYMSGGRFCTQCEAEGFRRITFWPDRPDVMSRFHVWMAADKATYPYLLSNGTPGETGALGDGRHYAAWDDPHPKPSYLFALCAGDYDVFENTFTTASGTLVDLAVHVDKGDAERTAWAMDSLKRSMTWDEDVFGREYDLAVFNIVAVRDFNFGAMENKGLNIFNSAYVLADENTATDLDFEAIESIVAHEYFHNWTGNRITCRDWFQLCLKEGLTVFRDQEFSADMRSRPVQRIKDVIRLRARQFPEDAGPLAHSVRPDAYASIDNLYTATVYEKGAELIRALKTMIGADAFKAGMELYFERHDGDAATIEDFYACFEAASGRDLSAFRVWYAQAGTPDVVVDETWDAPRGTLTVSFSQSVSQTPGQDTKQPVPIPLACALLDGDGGHVSAPDWEDGERLVVLDTAEAGVEIVLGAGTARPLLSINRGFSAPVRVNRNLDEATQIALAQAETDPLNRWDLLQGLARADILRVAGTSDAPSDDLIEALASAAEQASDDPAYAALLVRLPELGELMLEQRPANPASLAAARLATKTALALRLRPWIDEALSAPSPAPFNPGAEQAGIRARRTAAVDLLAAIGDAASAARLKALFEEAANMTESLAALRALSQLHGTPERMSALASFYETWRGNALVLDKWFSAQAGYGTAATVKALLEHEDFDLGNPNRVRAVVAAFAMQNLGAFHAADGSGHRLLAEVAQETDTRNPALAARLLTAFEQWKTLEPEARASAESALKALRGANLSQNAADIVTRALGAAEETG